MLPNVWSVWYAWKEVWLCEDVHGIHVHTKDGQMNVKLCDIFVKWYSILCCQGHFTCLVVMSRLSITFGLPINRYSIGLLAGFLYMLANEHCDKHHKQQVYGVTDITKPGLHYSERALHMA